MNIILLFYTLVQMTRISAAKDIADILYYLYEAPLKKLFVHPQPKLAQHFFNQSTLFYFEIAVF